MRTTRLTAAACALAALACLAQAQAQTPPADTSAAPPAAATPPAAKPDPVVAKVNGAEIHLSDVQEAIAGLPEEYRGLPPQMLFPMLLEQLVDRKAVVMLAMKQGLQDDPAIKRKIALAEDATLQNALFSRDIGPLVTEAKIKERYEATLANKPGEEEVHARHILVAKEDEAKSIIAELGKGGDFAALAKAHSTDPGAAQGGDLGFFKKGDMLPEFSAAAFALKPGEITQTPVHTQYGWHVIKLEERRQAPPPTLEQAHDQLRQEMIQEGVKKVVAQAREGLAIETFNPDGSVPKPAEAKPADAAAETPAPAKP